MSRKVVKRFSRSELDKLSMLGYDAIVTIKRKYMATTYYNRTPLSDVLDCDGVLYACKTRYGYRKSELSGHSVWLSDIPFVLRDNTAANCYRLKR